MSLAVLLLCKKTVLKFTEYGSKNSSQLPFFLPITYRFPHFSELGGFYEVSCIDFCHVKIVSIILISLCANDEIKTLLLSHHYIKRGRIFSNLNQIILSYDFSTFRSFIESKRKEKINRRRM